MGSRIQALIDRREVHRASALSILVAFRLIFFIGHGAILLCILWLLDSVVGRAVAATVLIASGLWFSHAQTPEGSKTPLWELLMRNHARTAWLSSAILSLLYIAGTALLGPAREYPTLLLLVPAAAAAFTRNPFHTVQSLGFGWCGLSSRRSLVVKVLMCGLFVVALGVFLSSSVLAPRASTALDNCLEKIDAMLGKEKVQLKEIEQQYQDLDASYRRLPSKIHEKEESIKTIKKRKKKCEQESTRYAKQISIAEHYTTAGLPIRLRDGSQVDGVEGAGLISRLTERRDQYARHGKAWGVLLEKRSKDVEAHQACRDRLPAQLADLRDSKDRLVEEIAFLDELREETAKGTVGEGINSEIERFEEALALAHRRVNAQLAMVENSVHVESLSEAEVIAPEPITHLTFVGVVPFESSQADEER